MKNISYILFLIFLSVSICSCSSDQWDSHYGQDNQEVKNEEVLMVELSAIEYLKQEPTLSSMYQFLKANGIIDNMEQRSQLFTILVVNNDSDINSSTVEDKEYLAKSHISNVSLSPAAMADGQRVLMWNGKYLNISKQETMGDGYNIAFNGSKVTRIIKTKDGYIYVLDSLIDSPRSMYEIIEGLDDDYSIFREMILSRNVNTFNKELSIPIGVDNTGSTIYDSVFTVENPYFEARYFDLMSESLSATMFIPSNAVINSALSKAKADLQEWGLTRADSIIENWVLQSAFYDRKLAKEDIEANVDLNSIFGKQWRTTVQQLDLDNPISMSNGVAYYVKSFKIPTNVLIYRLKDYMRWYENLSESDKNLYFVLDNLLFEKANTDVTAWSGWPAGGFPTIENRIIQFKLTDSNIDSFTMDFTPFQYHDNGNGTYTAVPYKIPPGEYDLCVGFKQSLGFDLTVYFEDNLMKTITTSDFTSTTYHYDRGAGGYPEGYDVNKATDSKKNNYDRDGGKVGTVVISGTTSKTVKITFAAENGLNGKKPILHHWCLKPTKNCY